MAAQDTSLDDIAESITSLATTMDQRFSALEERFKERFTSLENGQNGLSQRITDLETGQHELQTGQYHLQMNQRETNQRLDRIEGEAIALRNDVKELYQLTAH